MSSMLTDFTPGGMKIEGAYENDRNAASSQLFKDIIREVYSVSDVIIAHHLVFVREEKRSDGFAYQIVEELPSADALIFSHECAKKLWPSTYLNVLGQLALEPPETRDALLSRLYYGRNEKRAP